MSNDKDITNQVMTELRRIIRAIDLYSKKTVQRCGVTGPQLVVLKELENQDGITVGEIAVNVSLSSATVTDILGRMEKRGLVARTRSDRDKRRVIVRATDEGMKILQSAPSMLQHHFVEKFKQLQEWEKTLILSSLQRIVSMMNVEQLDASAVLTTYGTITDEPGQPEGSGEKQTA